MTIEIDHVIAVVDDLDTAGDRLLDEYGLASLPGGRHPGHGTGNRIVPLGSSYLELMAVVDPAEAAASRMGRWAGSRARDELSMAAVCLRTDDITAIADTLREKPLAMSRETPDGRTLSWQLAGFDEMIEYGWPFFIQWHSTPHPGAADAPHRVSPTGVRQVALVDAPPLLAKQIEAVDGVTVGAERMRAVIGTAAGEVSL